MSRSDSTRLILESHSWWGRLTCTPQFCHGVCYASRPSVKSKLNIANSQKNKAIPWTGWASHGTGALPSFPALPGHMFSSCVSPACPGLLLGQLAHISAVSSTPACSTGCSCALQQPAPSRAPCPNLVETVSIPEQELLSLLPLIMVTPSIIANAFHVWHPQDSHSSADLSASWCF